MTHHPKLHPRYGGAALVTGASSGLGEAFARRLARAGFDLVLVARRRDRLAKLARAIENKHAVRCTVLPADLSIAGAVDQLFSQIEQHRLDIGLIVNNAGFGTYGAFDEANLEQQSSMADLNCRAVLEVAHHGARLLKRRHRGAMIITSSVLGHFSLPMMATYSATKAFNLSLAEALWAELRPHGVDVHALCPGPTETEFHARAGSPSRTGLGMMSCNAVVDLSLRRLGRGPVVIPGFRNWVIVNSLRRMAPTLRMRLLSMVSRVGKNRAA